MNNKSILKPLSNKVTLSITVNGHKQSVTIPPTMRLIDLLREKLFLTGTKEGCGKGECGACTVLINGKAALSCLMLAIQADNQEITTIEGLSQNEKISPLQESFINEGASQCGFCIPGIIMAAHAFLNENRSPSINDIKHAIEGNFCRCTGYSKIFKAVLHAASLEQSATQKMR